VNDERAHLPADDVERNLESIVAELVEGYEATPERIFLARPCYDYAEGAPEILRGYCRHIDALVARLGLSPGPDFFEAYSRDKERWYGADPVHPNVAGMRRMAELWHRSIVRFPQKGNAQ
jgi:lysophospholipase L1-like esterase